MTPETDAAIDTDAAWEDQWRLVGASPTSSQATLAVLRLIDSPLVSVRAVYKSEEAADMLAACEERYDALSGGEKKLVQIARGLWNPQRDDQANLSVLGGLDRDNRRKVLMVLVAYYLGSAR